MSDATISTVNKFHQFSTSKYAAFRPSSAIDTFCDGPLGDSVKPQLHTPLVFVAQCNIIPIPEQAWVPSVLSSPNPSRLSTSSPARDNPLVLCVRTSAWYTAVSYEYSQQDRARGVLAVPFPPTGVAQVSVVRGLQTVRILNTDR